MYLLTFHGFAKTLTYQNIHIIVICLSPSLNYLAFNQKHYRSAVLGP
jgi:hypothetical protein